MTDANSKMTDTIIILQQPSLKKKKASVSTFQMNEITESTEKVKIQRTKWKFYK